MTAISMLKCCLCYPRACRKNDTFDVVTVIKGHYPDYDVIEEK